MQGFQIQLNKSAHGSPVSVAVCARYEKQILEHIRKVIPLIVEIMTSREAYTEEGMVMVRFTLPGVTNDQLSQIAWHIGEWYSRMEPLLNTNLN